MPDYNADHHDQIYRIKWGKPEPDLTLLSAEPAAAILLVLPCQKMRLLEMNSVGRRHGELTRHVVNNFLLNITVSVALRPMYRITHATHRVVQSQGLSYDDLDTAIE